MKFAQPVRASFQTSGGASFEPEPPKRRRPAQRSRVTVVTVDPRVWDVALGLAHGDPHRIQVLSETDVRVLNKRPF